MSIAVKSANWHHDHASFAIRSKLETSGHLVKPETILNVVTDDPDDNRVLECAAEGKAHYIINGDRHLLKLQQYEGILILTVRQFLTIFEEQRLHKH
jgi:predicted nucleic acid-binding protein